jgi:hypothetical protein
VSYKTGVPKGIRTLLPSGSSSRLPERCRGGKWVIRWYIGDGDYEVKTIAVADDKVGAGEALLDFRRAQALAREMHVEHMRVAKGLPADGGPYTVRACIEEYLGFLDANRKSGRDARYRAKALILPELGDVACVELTRGTLRSWLTGVAAASPRLRTKPGKEQKYRSVGDDDESLRRRGATANRELTILKAALNQAWREGKIPSDDAWRKADGDRWGESNQARPMAAARGHAGIDLRASNRRLGRQRMGGSDLPAIRRL